MAELTKIEKEEKEDAFLRRWRPKVKTRLPVVNVPVTDAHRTGTHELPSSSTIKIEENQTEKQRLEAEYLAAEKIAEDFFEDRGLDGEDEGTHHEVWREYYDLKNNADTLKRKLDNIKDKNRSTGGTRKHKKRGKKANSYRRTTRRHKKRGKKANSHRRKH